MIYPIIYVPNKYYLIVGEEIARGGDWGYMRFKKSVKSDWYSEHFIHQMSHGDNTVELRKIIAHLPLCSLPVLKGVSLLEKPKGRPFIKSLPIEFIATTYVADEDMSSQGGPYRGEIVLSTYINDDFIPVWRGDYFYTKDGVAPTRPTGTNK